MKSKRPKAREEKTGVHDVRLAREAIAREHRGDFQKHLEETNRIAKPIREKLGIKLVAPQPPPVRRTNG